MSAIRVHLSAEALEICQALLDHHRSLRAAPRRPPFDRCLIVYEELLALAGIAPRNLDACLDEIAEWCVQNDFPSIDALAVCGSTREPAVGYADGPGCVKDGWLEDAQRCLDFDYYPRLVIS